jgi:hypothetical protein
LTGDGGERLVRHFLGNIAFDEPKDNEAREHHTGRHKQLLVRTSPELNACPAELPRTPTSRPIVNRPRSEPGSRGRVACQSREFESAEHP